MRLRVGDRVQIEPPPHPSGTRLAARVVGWIEGHTLLVTVPHAGGGRLLLQQGEIIIVRAFTGRSAFAFGCSVLRNCSAVSDFLHLSFPDAIDAVDVRNSPRFRLRLPAKATIQSSAEAVEAELDNIGSTGALVVSPRRLGGIGDMVKLEFEVVLHDIPVALALNAAIRSAEPGADQTRHRHGVSFADPTPHDRLVLAALVWFHMYENPSLSA
jgi:hypothetical protein